MPIINPKWPDSFFRKQVLLQEPSRNRYIEARAITSNTDVSVLPNQRFHSCQVWPPSTFIRLPALDYARNARTNTARPKTRNHGATSINLAKSDSSSSLPNSVVSTITNTNIVTT